MPLRPVASALGITIMKTVNLFTNGCAQFVIGTLAATNDLCIKTPGVVLNEAANFIGAGLHLVSERTERALVNPSMPKRPYLKYVQDKHKADKIRARYLDGTQSLSDYWEDMGLNDYLSSVFNKDKAEAQPEATVIITDDK